MNARIRPSNAVEQTLWGDDNFSICSNYSDVESSCRPTLIDSRFPSTVGELSIHNFADSPAKRNRRSGKKGNCLLRGFLTKLGLRGVSVDVVGDSSVKRDYRHMQTTASTTLSTDRDGDDRSISADSVRTTRVQVDGENLLIRQGAARKLENVDPDSYETLATTEGEEEIFPYKRSISRRYLVRRVSSLTNASEQTHQNQVRRLADWGDPFYPTVTKVESFLTDDEESEDELDLFDDNLSTMSDPTDILFLPPMEKGEEAVRARDDFHIPTATDLNIAASSESMPSRQRSHSREERRFGKQDSGSEVVRPLSAPRRSVSSCIPRPAAVEHTTRAQTYCM